MEAVWFEVDDVCLWPRVDRADRGFGVRPGVGLLGPLTPLEVVSVVERNGWILVRLSGVVSRGVMGETFDNEGGMMLLEAVTPYRAGLRLFEEVKPHAAAEAWRRAGELGHLQAMLCLGALLTLMGERERTEGIGWYGKAAEGGHSYGMCMLGRALIRGEGIVQDTQKGLEWLEKSAGLGQRWAMLELGWHFEGSGAFGAARVWFGRAAELGCADAMLALGQMHSMGHGVVMDRAEGFRWVRKAAELGFVPPMRVRGSVFESGGGVDADSVAAMNWYGKAAEAGCGLAVQAM
jgi:TPR repeat protein